MIETTICLIVGVLLIVVLVIGFAYGLSQVDDD